MTARGSASRRRGPVRSGPTLVVLVVALHAVLSAAVMTACGGGGVESGTDVDASSDGRKVTVAGDSISVGLGAQLRGVLASPRGRDVVVKVIGEQGTGLARPDSFDWPARLRTLARDVPPDVLVFSVGSNDAQDLTDASGDVVVTRSEHRAWDAGYSTRLAAVFDAFRDTGTKVVWVGQVRAENSDVGATNRHVHELATEVAAERPWVTVTDLADVLGTGDAVASRCLVADGLHLSVACLREADEALAPQFLSSS